MDRLRLLVPPVEGFLFTACACSQLSKVPDRRGTLAAELAAAIEPLRGALDAFPFTIGLEHIAWLSSRLFNLKKVQQKHHPYNSSSGEKINKQIAEEGQDKDRS